MDTWDCGKCKGANGPEDRYCGECGAPRNQTIIAPIVRPSTSKPASGLLAEIKEAPAAAAEGAVHVVVAGLVSAVLFGVAYHYIARVIDFMIVFPALLGLAVGGSIRLAALQGRCRRAGLLVGVALLSGVAAFGLRQTMDTFKFQGEVRKAIAQDAAEVNLPPPTEAMASFGFFKALEARAEVGIGWSRRGGKTHTISGTMFWVFLLFETAIVAAVAAGTAKKVSLLAFCGSCRSFVPPVPVYRVNGRDSEKLADAVRRQLWKEAQDLTNRSSATEKDRAEASLIRCGGCNGSSIRVDLHEGRRSKKVLHVTLPPESLEALARTA